MPRTCGTPGIRAPAPNGWSSTRRSGGPGWWCSACGAAACWTPPARWSSGPVTCARAGRAQWWRRASSSATAAVGCTWRRSALDIDPQFPGQAGRQAQELTDVDGGAGQGHVAVTDVEFAGAQVGLAQGGLGEVELVQGAGAKRAAGEGGVGEVEVVQGAAFEDHVVEGGAAQVG